MKRAGFARPCSVNTATALWWTKPCGRWCPCRSPLLHRSLRPRRCPGRRLLNPGFQWPGLQKQQRLHRLPRLPHPPRRQPRHRRNHREFCTISRGAAPKFWGARAPRTHFSAPRRKAVRRSVHELAKDTGRKVRRGEGAATSVRGARAPQATAILEGTPPWVPKQRSTTKTATCRPRGTLFVLPSRSSALKRWAVFDIDEHNSGWIRPVFCFGANTAPRRETRPTTAGLPRLAA